MEIDDNTTIIPVYKNRKQENETTQIFNATFINTPYITVLKNDNFIEDDLHITLEYHNTFAILFYDEYSINQQLLNIFIKYSTIKKIIFGSFNLSYEGQFYNRIKQIDNFHPFILFKYQFTTPSLVIYKNGFPQIIYKDIYNENNYYNFLTNISNNNFYNQISKTNLIQIIEKPIFYDNNNYYNDYYNQYYNNYYKKYYENQYNLVQDTKVQDTKVQDTKVQNKNKITKLKSFKI